MRRIASLVTLACSLAVLGGAVPAAAGEPPVPDARHVALRVATYNIHAGAGMDNTFDLVRQAGAIRAMRADVVGLEEVDVHWGARSQWRDLAQELADMLDTKVFFGHIYSLDPPTKGAPRREYGIAILSRYPIVHAENHEITRLSTQDPNPVPAPAPGFPEAVVGVQGTLVHVYATHLDYRADPTMRQLQVADTKRIMAEDGDAQQLLLGDFNATPDAPELAPLWSDLTDAWYAAHGSGGESYPADVPVKRIDYVTVSEGIAVTSCEVVDTLASDHRPVVADLMVTRGLATL